MLPNRGNHRPQLIFGTRPAPPLPGGWPVFLVWGLELQPEAAMGLNGNRLIAEEQAYSSPEKAIEMGGKYLKLDVNR